MTRKRTAARAALLDTATVLLAENPGASFIEVAEAAGVGRATLYRHFASREELLRELCLEAIEATDQAVAPLVEQATSATDLLRRIIVALLPLSDRYHFLTRYPDLEDAGINARLQRQTEQTIALIQQAQHDGEVADDLSPAWIALVFDSLLYAAGQSIAEGKLEIEAAAELVFRTLMQGVSPAR